MQKVRKLGVLSFAKIYALSMAIFGVFIGAFIALMSTMAGLSAAEGGPLIALGWLAVVVVPIFYGVMGFIMGAIGAWVYNLLAGWIGGVEIELE